MCGAPVDVQVRTTKSGWTELPPVADMAKIQLGRTSCQIAGRLVPTAEFQLADGDTVYFPHPSLLWQDGAVSLDALPLKRAWSRMRAGLPLVMLQAAGPGRIAFSHNTAGELLAVPLQPGAAVDVREHQLVVASGAVDYDWLDSGVWFTTSGGRVQDQAAGVKLLKMGLEVAGMAAGEEVGSDNETEWHYPLGRYLDRFIARDRPGAVFIQAGGNAFIRDLAQDHGQTALPPVQGPVSRHAASRGVPERRGEVLAFVGQPVPVAAAVGPRPSGPAVAV
jgi:hypothetical protein